MKSNKSKNIFFLREIEIAFLAVIPSSKNDFWPYLELHKIEFGQKKIHEIDLFDFMSFYGLDFFQFSCETNNFRNDYYLISNYICVFSYICVKIFNSTLKLFFEKFICIFFYS